MMHLVKMLHRCIIIISLKMTFCEQFLLISCFIFFFHIQSKTHSSCLELCMTHAFKECSQVHDSLSPKFCTFYEIHSLLSTAISTTSAEKQSSFTERLQDWTTTFWDYVGHILRTKHQGDYYR